MSEESEAAVHLEVRELEEKIRAFDQLRRSSGWVELQKALDEALEAGEFQRMPLSVGGEKLDGIQSLWHDGFQSGLREGLKRARFLPGHVVESSREQLELLYRKIEEMEDGEEEERRDDYGNEAGHD